MKSAPISTQKQGLRVYFKMYKFTYSRWCTAVSVTWPWRVMAGVCCGGKSVAFWNHINLPVAPKPQTSFHSAGECVLWCLVQLQLCAQLQFFPLHFWKITLVQLFSTRYCFSPVPKLGILEAVQRFQIDTSSKIPIWNKNFSANRSLCQPCVTYWLVEKVTRCFIWQADTSVSVDDV